jgi:hypothetical protein
MEPDVHIFAMPKGGNSAEEYEDATGSSSEGRRFAIADGATQSSFADRWSQILALEYIMNPPADEPTPARWTNWLQPLQEAWSLGIPWEKLPWFAMEKAQAGACTTLLALEFIPNETGNGSKSARPAFWHRWLGIARHPFMRWRAEAVGDSCLFVVRDNRLVQSFPLGRPAEFNHSPMLITTNPRQNRLVCEHLRTIDGDCRPGDLFLLMTDALAKWFLGRNLVGEEPWHKLLALADNAEFKDYINAERDAGRLENDDTTLMSIRWPDAQEAAA